MIRIRNGLKWKFFELLQMKFFKSFLCFVDGAERVQKIFQSDLMFRCLTT